METTITVLVVGGDEPVRFARTKVLREAGFDVCEAACGREAIEAARDRRPDLILLDAACEIAEQLKSDPKTAGIPLCGPVDPPLLVRTVQELVCARRGEVALRRIGDLLNPPSPPQAAEQPYGDLAELNTTRVLAEAAGADTLREIAGDYLELLDSSSAIYENNGDYALRILSSGWCRLLDRASRALCATDDNAQALRSGEWLCHEECWRASREAIATEKPVDTECPAGIRLFAVPIMAGGTAAGSISLAYGDPPSRPEKLAEIARNFDVSVHELEERSATYESRPPFIVEVAKKRARSAARLLGSLVERRRADERTIQLNADLKRRVREFQSLFEVMPIGIGIAEDPECGFIRMNPALAQIVGMSPDQNCSKSGPDATFKVMRGGVEISPEELTLHTAARFGREMRDTELDVVRADGSVRNVLAHASPLFDESGKTRGSIGVFIDATERKLAEAALRESEGKLRAIVNALPVGVWFMDAQGRVFLTNSAAERIWAGPRYAWRGRYEDYRGRWFDTGEPVALGEWASARALKGETVLNQVIEIDCFDGARKVINNSAVPVFDESGGLSGAVVLNEDITERKNAEAALKKSEARLARAHRMASLGHWELDTAIPLLEWSDEVYSIFGVSREEFRPTREAFYECVAPEDRERCRAAIEETIASGKPYEIDHRIVLPGGAQRIVREHAEAARDETGRITRIIGTVQDVTEYRRLEEQFREAQKLESIGRLAGGVAHDFNNLLTVIIGYSDLVLSALETSHPVWDSVAEVKKAGERASALTRQLLTFSRRQVVQPRALDLNTIITDAEKMLQRLVGEDVVFSTVLEAALWPVMADPGSMQQVLLNLIVNARDAMPAGGRLIIETANVDVDSHIAAQHHGMNPGRHVLLSVSDTGVGMDKATRARIFEPFFTTKPKGSGTGLGLSTCYGIVTQSGGWIGVYSELGRGTTFKIYLPATETGPAVDAPADAAAPAGGSETILVVEDQEEVRRFTSDVLRKYGYTVLVAASGDEALNVLSEHTGAVDLVITDLVMPGMTGRELADRVAASRPGIPTLFMSGYSDEVATRQGVLEREAAYLQKPFAPKALDDKIREVLRSAASAD
jgi:PAS domain S-box-containing protein